MGQSYTHTSREREFLLLPSPSFFYYYSPPPFSPLWTQLVCNLPCTEPPFFLISRFAVVTCVWESISLRETESIRGNPWWNDDWTETLKKKKRQTYLALIIIIFDRVYSLQEYNNFPYHSFMYGYIPSEWNRFSVNRLWMTSPVVTIWL